MRTPQHYPSCHRVAHRGAHDGGRGCLLELARTVRFCIPFGNADAIVLEGPDASTRSNTWAGWPSMPGIGAYYELEVRCRGHADPVTGYLMNISHVDAAVRAHAINAIADAVRRPDHGDAPDAALILRGIIEPLRAALDDTVVSIRWHLTPFYSLTMETDTMDRVLFRQQFSFSAAHRLHCPELGDDENVAIFGKCNNPNGHGHNYRVEVSVSAPLPDPPAAAGLRLPALEQLVDEVVIQRFDHTHLNLDTEAFADLNPSVEHIARVCHDLLRDPIDVQLDARLEQVTVWETDKTSCTYPAPAPPPPPA